MWTHLLALAACGDPKDEGAPSDSDSDGDGYELELDCDDDDPDVHPDAEEVCDYKDNNCDGAIDEGAQATFFTDRDWDGYGDPSDPVEACTAPTGTVADGTDCDDSEHNVNPGEDELCATEGIDDDCDGLLDEADPSVVDATVGYVDDDHDGYGEASSAETFCVLEIGRVANGEDCDDSDAEVHPDAREVCDDAGVDEDCDGLANDDDPDGPGDSQWLDTDGDGYGAPETEVVSCDTIDGMVTNQLDCDDTNAAFNPDAPETCDALEVDEDCDGLVDELDPETNTLAYFTDGDGDGFGDSASVVDSCHPLTGMITIGGDCDDGDAAIHPAAAETCDDLEVDEDCDGLVDELDPETNTRTWYTDADGDGHGDVASAIVTCNSVSGYTLQGGDCDDTDSAIHSDADELCLGDGVDEDCDGLVDEDDPDTPPVAYWADGDGDGYGAGASIDTCQAVTGYVTIDGDCADSDSSRHPGAEEVCGDGVDRNCTGIPDDCIWGTLPIDAGVADIEGSTNDFFGEALESGGDFNGDGVIDLLMGGGTAGSGDGDAWMFFGPVAGTMQAVAADVHFSGFATNDEMGNAVAGGSDANGDGYDDVLIGLPGAGCAFVYFGPMSGPVDPAAATTRLCGPAGGDIGDHVYFTHDDWDGDGFDEVGVGSYWAAGGGTNQGATYIFSQPTSSVDVSTADWIYEGSWAYHSVGRAVSRLGDMDGDGLNELGMYSYEWVDGLLAEGVVYVLAGGGPTGRYALEDEAVGRVMGENEYDKFGESMGGVIDYDSDGYGDLVVGARGTEDGEVMVLLGPIVGDSTASDAVARFSGDANDWAGFSLDGAGDLDDDGNADLLIGAPGFDASSGAAFIVLGPATGVHRLADVAYASVQNDATGEYGGRPVTWIPDWDGDGADEMAFGSRTAGTNTNGRVYVFEGSQVQ